MKVSSSGYKVLYKRQDNFSLKKVEQALARMSKREIRKFLIVGTLTGIITTVKHDDWYSLLFQSGALTNFPHIEYQKRFLKSCTNIIIVIHFSEHFEIYFTYKIYLV